MRRCQIALSKKLCPLNVASIAEAALRCNAEDLAGDAFFDLVHKYPEEWKALPAENTKKAFELMAKGEIEMQETELPCCSITYSFEYPFNKTNETK